MSGIELSTENLPIIADARYALRRVPENRPRSQFRRSIGMHHLSDLGFEPVTGIRRFPIYDFVASNKISRPESVKTESAVVRNMTAFDRSTKVPYFCARMKTGTPLGSAA